MNAAGAEHRDEGGGGDDEEGVEGGDEVEEGDGDLVVDAESEGSFVRRESASSTSMCYSSR